MKKTLLAALAALFATTDLVADIKFTYKVRTDGNVAITSFAKSTKGAVAVPSEIDGKKIVALQGAFNGCTKVTSITIPATVKEIGDYTFKNTSKLKTLTFADGSSGVFIGDYVFTGSKLKQFTIPANSTVSDFAFYDSKVATLEVMDDDPATNLSNIDDFLSPYNAAGTKLMSEIKTLIVPSGCVGNYTPYVTYFLSGRKKKNWGTVRAQYPRVFAVKTYGSDGAYQGTGYFKVNGKKVSSGTPVKPATKVQFVATAATGFAPQDLRSNKTGVDPFMPVGSGDYMYAHTFNMPAENIYYKAYFTTLEKEKNGLDMARSSFSFTPIYATKGVTDVNKKLFNKTAPVTKTTVSVVGLPSGMSLSLESDGFYYLKGTPTTALSLDYAPAFVILKGASGAMRIVRLPLNVTGAAIPSSVMTPNTSGISQDYSAGVLGVLAGLSYPKGKDPVLFTAPKKITAAKASGLPAGIKLQKVSNTAYTLVGRPTKPGAYVTTVTLTVGGKKETHRFAYEVHASPLAGSYRGYVSSYKLGCGAVTMSVAADGKGTLKFTEGTTTTSVTAYPTVETGTSWNPANPFVGRFRYAFSVPKDKKRKLAKRTLKLAYYTDASSGLACRARVRQGPLAGFSLTKSETLRLFPVYSVPELKKCTFYSTSYRRDHGGFSLLIGPSETESDGEAIWAAADYNYDNGKVYLAGRLPAGKLFSATVPLVASYHANDAWNFTESMNYRALEAAPVVVKDSDGVVYVLKFPADPSEFKNNADARHETVGVHAWNRDGDGLFQWLTGTYKFNNRKSPYPASALRVFTGSGTTAAPKLKLTFNVLPWSSALALNTSVNATTIDVNNKGKQSYEFDPETGLWTFQFIYGGLTYVFEGVPTMKTWNTAAPTFHGMVGRTADGKNWTWGAAKVE